MYIVIGRYAGAAGKIAEAAPKVQQGLVPLIKEQPGFLGYAALASEQGEIVAFFIWKTAETMALGRDKVRSWLANNLPEEAEPTERFIGEVGLHAIAEPQSGGPGQSLYCLIRRVENLSAEGPQSEARKAMLAAAQKAPGFRGLYYARSTDDLTRGASILLCDTREHAAAIHEEAMVISKQMQPDVTIRVMASGESTILAMA
ncbi:antibiotic biosynthesis monooxygenase [Belnapia moabensis]|uniref:antibiotic biosynthesis monooxygenase n=1 Tax=Belnapia moabensis TaxID=365533 RepID=UPI0005BA21DE|nr:antibiotic biosynthesis monooxygenase [Belnapia moabensis]